MLNMYIPCKTAAKYRNIFATVIFKSSKLFSYASGRWWLDKFSVNIPFCSPESGDAFVYCFLLWVIVYPFQHSQNGVGVCGWVLRRPFVWSCYGIGRILCLVMSRDWMHSLFVHVLVGEHPPQHSLGKMPHHVVLLEHTFCEDIGILEVVWFLKKISMRTVVLAQLNSSLWWRHHVFLCFFVTQSVCPSPRARQILRMFHPWKLFRNRLCTEALFSPSNRANRV